ncbi:hypothetical protein Rhal01_03105 [Rubritalea halochordaticola]|uniref:Lycopene cyclase domain-containing protein n=1 Tax=Rubritalea halochordaticola TaxID=714537 RepID=A0ABP9V2M2_9BACT
MSFEDKKLLVEYGLLIVPFLIAVVLCYPMTPILKYSHPFKRYLLSVLVGWFAILVYNDQIWLPMRLASADRHGNMHYDGVGMNAVLLVFGWIVPVLISLPFFLHALWNFSNSKKA